MDTHFERFLDTDQNVRYTACSGSAISGNEPTTYYELNSVNVRE